MVWYRRTKVFAPHLSPNPEWKFDPDRPVQDQISELPYNLNFEFPRLDISLVRIIGEGHFGEVWEAKAEGITAFRPKDNSELSLRSKLANIYARENSGNDFWVKYFRREYYPPQYSEDGRVAIKCLKPGAPENYYTDLASELKLMIHIGEHKNIVNLMGACTQRGPLWVILEFCPHGDLRRFIRTKTLLSTWDRFELSSTDHICFVDMIRMSMEIAEGMIFLSMSGIIHRDLAARNILVGNNMEMKIADFGLARDIGGVEEEYNKESEAAVPVRWTAPEAMNLGTYTTASDVWSYGIVLWELFSMGQQPYGGLSNYEVKQLLERNERMNAPTNCPQNIFLLMKTTWNANVKERPDFIEVLEFLVEIRRSAYAPSDDYYTGGKATDSADDNTDDEFIDCTPILREKRIEWLRRAGVSVNEDNVDELLDHMWGGGDESTTGSCTVKTTEEDELNNAHINSGYSSVIESVF